MVNQQENHNYDEYNWEELGDSPRLPAHIAVIILLVIVIGSWTAIIYGLKAFLHYLG